LAPSWLSGQERGYLRHAAVAVVQAVDGEVTIVPDSTLDPIADTWVRVLPGLFGTWTGLPQGLRTLFAPPAGRACTRKLPHSDDMVAPPTMTRRDTFRFSWGRTPSPAATTCRSYSRVRTSPH
jgi:hypothetical protein